MTVGIPAPGEILAARYQVTRSLGQGGMGAVLEALDIRVGRAVAIKWILPDFSNDLSQARLFTEARAMARIEHPNVLAVLDVAFDRAPFLVMEMLRGESLEQHLERGPIAISEAIEILIQASEGVAAAHAEGIIHRDLKPGNVFLCEDRDGTRRVKILDFGLAKLFDESGGGPRLSRTGIPVGTPRYMSPEQLDARRPTPAFDVYALGVVLYQVLAQRPPFDAPGLVELLTEIKTGRPPPVRTWNAMVPEALESLVMRAIARDPLHRPSLGAFRAGLEPWRQGFGDTTLEEIAYASTGRNVIPATRKRAEAIDLREVVDVAAIADVPAVVSPAPVLTPVAPKAALRRWGLVMVVAVAAVAVLIGAIVGTVRWLSDHPEDPGRASNDHATDSGIETSDDDIGAPPPAAPTDGTLGIELRGNCRALPFDSTRLTAFSTDYDTYVTVGNYYGHLATAFLMIFKGNATIGQPCDLARDRRTGCSLIIGAPGTSYANAFEALENERPERVARGSFVVHEWAPAEGRVRVSLRHIVLPGQHEGFCEIDGEVELVRVSPVPPQ